MLQIPEKTNKYNIDNFRFFFELKSAYDSMLRTNIYDVMIILKSLVLSIKGVFWFLDFIFLILAE